MIIADLDCFESANNGYEIDGGKRRAKRYLPLFEASSAFLFDSLAIGYTGAFAGGESNTLTTAFPGQYSVGLTYTYQSIATGLPL